MVWWLGVPVALWVGKKAYDAVRNNSDDVYRPAPDDGAAVRRREREAQRELALERARMLVRSYLQGEGVMLDDELERLLVQDGLASEAGRQRLLEVAMGQFEESQAMVLPAIEIHEAQSALFKTRSAKSSLAMTTMTWLLEKMVSTLDAIVKSRGRP